MAARYLPVLLLVFSLSAQQRLAVTVVDQFGAALTDLKAEEFIVQGQRRVLSAEYRKDLVDVAILVDTSAFSGQRRDPERAAAMLIRQLEGKEQMALLSYATSAELMQEFTSSQPLLLRALAGFRYGNDAAVMDGVYAAIDSGFEQAAGRRVLIVISSGYEGFSKVKRSEIVDLAASRKVSVFAIDLSGRTSLEDVARDTGGAYLSGRELRQIDTVTKNLYQAMRGQYILTVEGEGKARVEVKRPGEKIRVGARPL